MLMHKLAMLLALTTASKAAEIQGLDLGFMSDIGNVIDFTLSKLTKTRRVGQKPYTISLLQLEAKPLLSVVELSECTFEDFAVASQSGPTLTVVGHSVPT